MSSSSFVVVVDVVKKNDGWMDSLAMVVTHYCGRSTVVMCMCERWVGSIRAIQREEKEVGMVISVGDIQVGTGCEVSRQRSSAWKRIIRRCCRIFSRIISIAGQIL